MAEFISPMKRRQLERIARREGVVEESPAPVPVASTSTDTEEPHEISKVREGTMSPMQRRKLERMAESESRRGNEISTDPSVEQHLLGHYVAALKADNVALKSIKDIDAKNEYKRKALGKYGKFEGEYLKKGHKYPNEILSTLVVWRFDIEKIQTALHWAFFLIKQGCHRMPERFKRRNIETFVCDEIYEWANRLLVKKQSARPYLDKVIETMDAEDAPWDVHPIVRGKLYAMQGKLCLRVYEKFGTAVTWLEKAMDINPDGAGVKTILNEARIKAGRVS
uniref:Phage small terminase subunit n=1 Tax=Candidatus Kentrum sp. LFY TaxID=2126342 RepID=A0A450WI39_9GAMM|nr:MAG: Phage small terminase subunit [Candidatus Kentron sp. LFY]